MAKETELHAASDGGSSTVSATMRARISYGSRVGRGRGSEELMMRKCGRKGGNRTVREGGKKARARGNEGRGS